MRICTLSGLLLIAATSATAEISDLSRAPLFVRPPVAPNIVLSFDDSTSMFQAYTPNEIEGGYLPRTAADCFWRDYPHFYSSDANSQYFDPNVIYVPPLYETGLSFKNAVYAAAYLDGFDAHRTGTEVTTALKMNLGKSYDPSLYYDSRPTEQRNWVVRFANTATTGSCSRDNYQSTNGISGPDAKRTWVKASASDPNPTEQAAFYYEFQNPNAIDPITLVAAKPTLKQLFDCTKVIVPPATQPTCQLTPSNPNGLRNRNLYTPKLVTAAQEQNFANWFSYYRTRQLTARSAATIAFAQLPRNVRIAWQGLNNGSLNSLNGGALTNATPIIKIEDNVQRRRFYSYLHTVNATSGTPSRSSLVRVGTYFSDLNTSTTVESNPYYDVKIAADIAASTSGGSPILSCRQNYHMLVTDGGWKDDIGRSSGIYSTTTGTAGNLGKNYDQTATAFPDGKVYPDSTHGKVYNSGPAQIRTVATPYIAEVPNVSPERLGHAVSGGAIAGYADYSFYYWSTDLKPSLANNVPTYLEDRTTGVTGGVTSPLPANPFSNDEIYWNPKNDPATWQHLVQFVVAFGLSTTLDFPGDLNALRTNGNPKTWTNWAPEEGFDFAEKVDDTWHATLNSRGDLLSASNPQELVQQMNSVFQSISNRTTSVSAVSISSSFLSTATLAFQTYFNASAWSGTVQGRRRLPNGASEIAWDAACRIDGGPCEAIPGNPSFSAPDPLTGRVILTTNSSSNTGVNFVWSSLSAEQQSALNFNFDTNLSDGKGQDRLNFVRGVRTGEGTVFRSRESVFGAVVNSNAVFVGAATDGYWRENQSATNPPQFPGGPETKTNFRTHVAAVKNRLKTIYVGANDGMMHALNADTGEERWAFVPKSVYRNLARLTAKSALKTQSFVDSTPVVREVYFGGAWKTLLVGGLRLGGQGIYALDVTDPSPGVVASSRVLWEFNDKNDSALGYTYGRPAIARLANGRWAVFVPGGYNSDATDYELETNHPHNTPANERKGTGVAVMFVLDAQNGSLITRFDLGTGSAGLSSVVVGDYVFQSGIPTVSQKVEPSGSTAFPGTQDFQSEVAFAGDDNGDLWRFDVRGPSLPASVACLGSTRCKKFFDATNGSSITAQPRIANANGFPVVAFGSGRFAADSDRANSLQQSVYGVYDPGPDFLGYPLRDINLREQTLTSNTLNGRILRTTTDAAVAPTQFGWYFKLPTNSGERAIVPASYLTQPARLIVPTFTPSSNSALANDPCQENAVSTLYFLNPENGGPARADGLAAFDVNGDGSINASDSSLVSGIQIPGFIAGATPINQSGGGELEILLPGVGLGTPVQCGPAGQAGCGSCGGPEQPECTCGGAGLPACTCGAPPLRACTCADPITNPNTQIVCTDKVKALQPLWRRMNSRDLPAWDPSERN